MKIICWQLALALLGGITTAPVQAGPMGFEHSWMSMGDLGPNWAEVWANYAVTPRDAFGVGALYMRSDDERRSRELVELTYTRLLHRWNARNSQANLWFVGGVGAVDGNRLGGADVMVSPGIQFDYETTRVYFSATNRFYRSADLNHDYSAVRAGFSFYEVDYDETQPWFVVEVRHMHDLSDQAEITPMIRLINKRYFVEGGVSNSAQVRFNFMYIF